MSETPKLLDERELKRLEHKAGICGDDCPTCYSVALHEIARDCPDCNWTDVKAWDEVLIRRNLSTPCRRHADAAWGYVREVHRIDREERA